ncbi:MAG: helix-turn-helix domain-containing protein [Clostridia bacterium]|nr:helix-turn-helix domain-containing protein [Clostridia bacterium]
MKFKKLLNSKGTTCYALAKKLYVSVQTVYSWAWGRSTPNPETILKIKEILNVTAEEVLLCFVND